MHSVMQTLAANAFAYIYGYEYVSRNDSLEIHHKMGGNSSQRLVLKLKYPSDIPFNARALLRDWFKYLMFSHLNLSHNLLHC